MSPDSYLTRIPAIGLLQELAFRRPVTFFVGENGSGKSTLLEAVAIAYGFNPEVSTKAIEYEKGISYLEYEETESYRITEMMINHRDLMVSQVLP